MNSEKEKLGEKRPRLLLATALLFFGILIVSNGVRGLLDSKQRLVAPRGQILVEVVDTEQARVLGLSDRDELDRDEGMLFVFEDSSSGRCFWMKDMNFPVDMVWLDADKKVVQILDDVKPETYPESFCSEEPAKYVLEVVSGRAGQLGISDNGVELRF